MGSELVRACRMLRCLYGDASVVQRMAGSDLGEKLSRTEDEDVEMYYISYALYPYGH